MNQENTEILELTEEQVKELQQRFKDMNLTLDLAKPEQDLTAEYGYGYKK